MLDEVRAVLDTDPATADREVGGAPLPGRRLLGRAALMPRPSPQELRRRRAIAVLVALGVVAIIVIGGAVARRGRRLGVERGAHDHEAARHDGPIHHARAAPGHRHR